MPKASKSVNEAEGVVNARDMIAMMILIKIDQSDNAVSIQVNVHCVHHSVATLKNY